MPNETTTVELATPIEQEGKEPVHKVELRKPNAGNLRGLKFSAVLEMDFDTMSQLIPKISNLTTRDMLNIDPVNYAPLFMGVAGFFVNTESEDLTE